MAPLTVYSFLDEVVNSCHRISGAVDVSENCKRGTNNGHAVDLKKHIKLWRLRLAGNIGRLIEADIQEALGDERFYKFGGRSFRELLKPAQDRTTCRET